MKLPAIIHAIVLHFFRIVTLGRRIFRGPSSDANQTFDFRNHFFCVRVDSGNQPFLPRHRKRNGLTKINPLRWANNQYGSVAISAHDASTADDMNDKGLAVHMLYLPETSVGERDENVPGTHEPSDLHEDSVFSPQFF